MLSLTHHRSIDKMRLLRPVSLTVGNRSSIDVIAN
jgi:hypothetical protein